jgi:hypothetical protein
LTSNNKAAAPNAQVSQKIDIDINSYGVLHFSAFNSALNKGKIAVNKTAFTIPAGATIVNTPKACGQ